MQDLELLDEYLIEVRREKLRASHALLVSGSAAAWTEAARNAHEADLVERIRGAVRDLSKDQGVFIQKHIKRET